MCLYVSVQFGYHFLIELSFCLLQLVTLMIPTITTNKPTTTKPTTTSRTTTVPYDFTF